MKIVLPLILATAGLAACSSNADGDQRQSTMATNDDMAADNGMAGNDMASGATSSATADPGAEAAAPMPTAAVDYLKVAAASDLFERKSSSIAEQKAQDPQVRDFARRMITDHNKTTATLKAAAAKDGVTPPPPALMPAQQQQLDQLKSADKSGFDQLYVQQQLAAHQQALALHQNFAQSGDKPALKQAASQAVPIIQDHLTMVQKLAR